MYLTKIVFQCKCVSIFTFINFSTNFKKNVGVIFFGKGGNGRFCTAVFCKNLGATCTRHRGLWI